MNAERRKKLREVNNKLIELITDVNDVIDEEQAYYDNMPESIQNGAKGEATGMCIEELTNAVSSMDDALMGIQEQLDPNWKQEP